MNNSYRLRHSVQTPVARYVRTRYPVQQYCASVVFCRVYRRSSPLAVAFLRLGRAVQLVQPRLETRLLTRPQHLRAHVERECVSVSTYQLTTQQ